MMAKVVGFLQNAWSGAYAGGTWPRASWLRALEKCRSGRRLKVLADASPGVAFWWDNTTPVVGECPGSVVPANCGHIALVLDEQAPDAALAFGRQAALAMPKVYAGPLLLLPHPAYRLVTNRLYREAWALLLAGFAGTLELRQGRGCVETLTR